jgi:hypothetical protein
MHLSIVRVAAGWSGTNPIKTGSVSVVNMERR